MEYENSKIDIKSHNASVGLQSLSIVDIGDIDKATIEHIEKYATQRKEIIAGAFKKSTAILAIVVIGIVFNLSLMLLYSFNWGILVVKICTLLLFGLALMGFYIGETCIHNIKSIKSYTKIINNEYKVYRGTGTKLWSKYKDDRKYKRYYLKINEFILEVYDDKQDYKDIYLDYKDGKQYVLLTDSTGDEVISILSSDDI